METSSRADLVLIAMVTIYLKCYSWKPFKGGCNMEDDSLMEQVTSAIDDCFSKQIAKGLLKYLHHQEIDNSVQN